MRAVFTTERFLATSPNSSVRSCGLRRSNEQPKDAPNPPSARPEYFFDKLLTFVKSWKTFQAHNRQLKPKTAQRMPQIKKIVMKQNHASKSAKSGQDSSKTAESQSQCILEFKPVEMPHVAPRLPKKLPAYPVVPLEETLNRYLNSIRPLFGRMAFEQQKELTSEFLRNEGQQLQKLLEADASDSMNWLTERWTTVNYLRHRSPLTIFSSPCVAFPQQQFPNVCKCLDFTARTIYAMCEFNRLVERHQLPVRNVHGFELDNSQFHNVFGTVRVPQRCCDVLTQCASNYVVVIHKNNFYKLLVYTEQKKAYNVQQIRKQLLKVVRSGRAKGPPIGLLTHDTRDNWAEGHEMLCRKELNALAVQCIENALFTVSLDDGVEVSAGRARSVLAAQLLHGGGSHVNSANRWMDKTLQLIVNPRGFVGVCCEHAPAESQPTITIMDHVLQNIVKPNYGQEPPAMDDGRCKHLEHIRFAEINECIGFWLNIASQNVDRIAEQLQVHAFQFDGYGTEQIRAQGLAPDSYVQMALQLAFYRQHGRLAPQLELAHLRIFQWGRSEIIRSTTAKSRKFVRAMIAQKATATARRFALCSAVDGHQRQTKLALHGRAVDSHLFGLRQMAEEHCIPLPPFFQSAGYLRSRNFRIASLPLITPHDAFMVYGPPNAEGYGCCYNLREKDITFAITAWNQKPQISAERFGSRIESVLAEMGQLIRSRPGRRTASRNT